MILLLLENNGSCWMSHRRTWGVVGLDGQQHLQVRRLPQSCGDKIYMFSYEYYMTCCLSSGLLAASFVDAATGTPNCRRGKEGHCGQPATAHYIQQKHTTCARNLLPDLSPGTDRPYMMTCLPRLAADT